MFSMTILFSLRRRTPFSPFLSSFLFFLFSPFFLSDSYELDKKVRVTFSVVM